MNKIVATVGAVVVAGALAVGTGIIPLGGGDNADKGSGDKTLTLWTFTTMKPQIDAMKKLDPDAPKIKEVVVPYENFQTKLDKVMGTDKQPDLVALDAGFVKKYVDSGMLADLNKYGAKDAEKNNFPYTIQIGQDSKKQQVALSYQAAPGALYYRTSLLQKYLGIGKDDTAAAQKAFSSWDEIEKTAQKVKVNSGGKAYLFSSLQEIYNPVLGAREHGWVEGKKLVIDDSLTTSLDTMKKFVENGWTKNTVGQSSDWFSGMSSDDIVSYSLPSWGLFYWLTDYAKSKDTGKDTTGDWHVIQGPQSYSWGGTWFGAVSGTKNEEAAAKLAIYFSTDKKFQNWQATENSDFVARKDVNEEAGKNAKVKILGDQNPYPTYAKVADTINGATTTKYDQQLQTLWINDAVNPYANGKVSKETALKNFKSDVKNAFPDLTVN